jgi:hypothetical protein
LKLPDFVKTLALEMESIFIYNCIFFSVTRRFSPHLTLEKSMAPKLSIPLALTQIGVLVLILEICTTSDFPPHTRRRRNPLLSLGRMGCEAREDVSARDVSYWPPLSPCNIHAGGIRITTKHAAKNSLRRAVCVDAHSHTYIQCVFLTQPTPI